MVIKKLWNLISVKLKEKQARQYYNINFFVFI